MEVYPNYRLSKCYYSDKRIPEVIKFPCQVSHLILFAIFVPNSGARVADVWSRVLQLCNFKSYQEKKKKNHLETF